MNTPPFSQETRSLLLDALRLHQEGNLDDAAGLYRRALTLSPEQPDGNRLYGTLCLQAGRYDEAELHLRKALTSAPTDAETHSNLGAVLIQVGRLVEAITELRAAISLRPGFADALSNLGEVLRQTGDADGAHAALTEALAVNPDHANALFNLGVLKTGERDYPGAIQCLERTLVLFPGHIAARRQLANVHITTSNYLDAERLCRDLLAQDPDDHEVRVALASIFIAALRYDAALLEVRHVLDRVPNHPRALICRGQVLRQTGQPNEALAIFQDVALRHPDEPRASGGIVEIFLQRGELNAALSLAEEVVSRHPENGLAYLDEGTVLEKLGRTEDACDAYRAGLVRLPDQPALHFNLGNQLLLLGRFDEGWREYEWRTRLAVWGIRDANWKAWSGESLAGKSLLIEAEQGMGDMIQFIRLAPLVAARGADILLECQPELLRLFKSAAGVQHIVPKPYLGAALPDLRVSLLSLPGLLGIRLENIPASVPYLAAPAELANTWKDRLAGDAGLRVGIAWSGNPQHINDANRSCSVALFSPLLSLTGATFYSLQKGGGPALAAAQLAGKVRDYTGEWSDFADTAAFMRALDLVISIDTAVVHLAGALSIPVWTLLPFAPDWRWMTGRDDSPWYPTMRLLRQQKPRDWQSVISQATLSLAEEIRSRAIQPG